MVQGEDGVAVMKLRTSDYFLTRVAHGMRTALKLLGEVETDLLRGQLDDVTLDRPVFVCSLARSGSTIMLNLLSSLSHVATHCYRDFPFVFVPYAWNSYQGCMTSNEAPIERPHQDRIYITKDSPDAFEEPLWEYFFPFVHDPQVSHILTAHNDHPRFNKFYLDHLRKILLVRNGRRYISKGNYNVARLEYLCHLLPDARFVVPVRHPLTQVDSLVRQHRLFTRYSEENPRIPLYMQAVGHYEFGPQRVPINIDRESPPRILSAWADGHDEIGYAVMWQSVYAHVQRLCSSGTLQSQIKVVRYEDLCSNPRGTLEDVFHFCDLTEGAEEFLAALPDVSAPSEALKCLNGVQSNAVWHETAHIAETFGYTRMRMHSSTA
jgi:Sulfotransferase family